MKHFEHHKLKYLTTTALIISPLGLNACGGSATSTPPPPPPPAVVADTTPPSVSISASKLNIEGGETVILSFAAEDDSGEAVETALECDGGDLRQEFLITQETQENFEIVCTCLLYTSPSPRDKRQSRMPSSA